MVCPGTWIILALKLSASHIWSSSKKISIPGILSESFLKPTTIEPNSFFNSFNDSLAFLLFQTEEKPFPFKNNSEEEVIIEAEEIEDSSSKQETD